MSAGNAQHTLFFVREEVTEKVVGHNADVALDVVVENELCGDWWLVLAAPTIPYFGCRSSNSCRRIQSGHGDDDVGDGVGVRWVATGWTFRNEEDR